MTTLPERDTGSVLGAQIDALSWDAALARLLGWARARESRYVTICNVHVVVSASRDAAYRKIINGSDMATPDGAPVAWMLRRQGFVGQPRISGPDLMWALCGSVAREYLPVYCYGGCAGEHCHGDWPPGACRVGSGLIFQGEGKAQDSRGKIQDSRFKIQDSSCRMVNGACLSEHCLAVFCPGSSRQDESGI